MTVLEKAGKIAAEPMDAVRAWKRQSPSARAIGYFPVYAPLPVLDACGILGVGITGGGGLEVENADSRVQSFVCSITRSTLEMGLRGMLKDLDGMLFSNICDVARNLSGVWERNFPDARTIYLHYPQNMEKDMAADYLVSEFERLARELGGMDAGFDERLAAAIAARNAQQRLLRELEEMRRAEPWKLSWAEHYRLRRAGLALPVEEHSAMLKEAIAAVRAATARPRDGVRVIVEGAFCEQPSLELLEVVEDAGAFVMDDDCLLSQRWFQGDVPLNGGAPLRSLAEAYLTRSHPSSVRHEGKESRAEALLNRVRAQKADGVLFMSPKFCEPALYDYVRMKDRLERTGVPNMAVEYQEHGGAYDSLQMQVQTFVESVLFFSQEAKP